ncbi:MAG: hypothetical protein CMJ45_01275 [Planctomyces sp.]|nr:hypothetical protein [Planctomyces sp.]
MRVNFGFLCDHFAHKDGKPTAVGIGLDAFFASGTPVRHPGFDAVISLRFSQEEAGGKSVGLGVTDREGVLIAPARYEDIHIEPVPGQLYQNKTVKISISDTEFPSFGDYLVIWLLDGLEVHNLPLKVMQETS